MPVDHLHLTVGPERCLLREVLHDRILEEHARLAPESYEGLVEEMVRCQDSKVLDASSGGSISIARSGRMNMKNTRPREEGMPPHDATDILFLLMDRAHQRDLPAPGSRRETNYRTIVVNTVTACEKFGLSIPMDCATIAIALSRAGLAEDLSPISIDNAPATLNRLNSTSGGRAEPRLIPETLDADFRRATRNVRSREVEIDALCVA